MMVDRTECFLGGFFIILFILLAFVIVYGLVRSHENCAGRGGVVVQTDTGWRCIDD